MKVHSSFFAWRWLSVHRLVFVCSWPFWGRLEPPTIVECLVDSCACGGVVPPTLPPLPAASAGAATVSSTKANRTRTLVTPVVVTIEWPVANESRKWNYPAWFPQSSNVLNTTLLRPSRHTKEISPGAAATRAHSCYAYSPRRREPASISLTQG